MASVVYILCTVTALACMVLLLRAWSRSRMPLLLWSGLCFACLTVSNGLLFVDLAVLTDVDLLMFRIGAALIAAIVLVVGLVWSSR